MKYYQILNNQYGKQQKTFETEKDFALYCLTSFAYKSMFIKDQNFDNIKYYNENNQVLNQENINSLIEKHFPKQAEKISKKKEKEEKLKKFNHKIFLFLMKHNLIEHHLIFTKKIIENMPQESIKKVNSIAYKKI